MNTEPLQLFAFRYGVSPCPENLIFAGENTGRNVALAWACYLLQTASARILIDCGFNDPEKAKQFGITLVADPVAMLATVGVPSDSITHLVVTHHHFDHTGNLPRFPRATVIIQAAEYDLYRQEWPSHPEIPASRLVRFDSEYQVEGLSLRRIGGHTPGCTEVSLQYDGQRYVIPGDECYQVKNYLERKPIGFASCPETNRNYIRSLPRDLILLPFHDPAIFENYPQVTDDVVRIFPEG